MGAKKKKQYRIVVADSRAPVKGKYLESIGHYDPRHRPTDSSESLSKESTDGLKIDVERAQYWLGVGAQPSETVRGLLRVVGIIDLSGNLVRVEGSELDPLVELYMQYLLTIDPALKKQGHRHRVLAKKFAEMTRQWGRANSPERENFMESEPERRTWFKQFVDGDDPLGRRK